MVQANLDFMDQHEQTANTLAEEANTEFDKYKQLKDKCLQFIDNEAFRRT